jgi:hypothetical protein
MSWPFLLENRLDSRFEDLEIERFARLCPRLDWSGMRHPTAMKDPIGQHLPFGIVLRCPELATGMHRIATRFLGKRMKQQTTLQGFTRRD